MIEIIPAIIPKNFKDLERNLEAVAGLVPLAQIDIMDGKFTPEASWPYQNSQEDPDFVSIKIEEREFPALEEIDFEVDLMVSDPEAVLQQWISAGAKRIIPHYESFKDESVVLEFTQEFQNQYGGDGSFTALELGIALNIETPSDVLEAIIENIDFVQCMGIARIGYQGEPFDERVLDKIREIHDRYPDLPISVDGGVNLSTASALVEAGATRLVAGSAIFGSDDIPATIEEFQNLEEYGCLLYTSDAADE